jgi:hypothetical protein
MDSADSQKRAAKREMMIPKTGDVDEKQRKKNVVKGRAGTKFVYEY